MQMYDILAPELASAHYNKMVAGQLLCLHSDEAKQMVKKYDLDGDGMSEGEIENMLLEIYESKVKVLKRQATSARLINGASGNNAAKQSPAGHLEGGSGISDPEAMPEDTPPPTAQ